MFIYEDGISLKLPPDRYESVLDRGDVVPFQPMRDRKPMATWVVWSMPEPEEYEAEWDLIEMARSFVMAEPPNPKKKKK
ncbi:MAG: hypothetical protein P9L92_18410 [Candidatus Electryonea clarkiae]|nr:hypothetical protein [Candidatus Electryonea clarkiae]MDP8286172.1 hypothetical protein [Candidatus Electryonea clarkiae]